MSEQVTEREYLDEAITASEACKLFGLGKDRFLRTRACLPSFPAAVNDKPKAWIRGEILQWRDDHRAEKKAA